MIADYKSEKNLCMALFRRRKMPLAQASFLYQAYIEHEVQIIGFIYLQIRAMPILWSGRPCYPSSAQNRYPAIYVGWQDSSKLFKALHNHRFQSSFYMSFFGILLNNKTIILLNRAEYRLVLANSADGLFG